MKGYKFKGSGFVFCYIIGIILLVNPLWAAEFCVETEAYIPHPNLSIFDYFLFLLKQTDGSV